MAVTDHIPLSRRMRRADVVLAVIALLLAGPFVLGALASGFGWWSLPYPLLVVLQRLPVLFPLHMIASSLALILIPIAALLRRNRGAHRAAGRAAAVCVAIGALTALPVAVMSEATAAARAGLFTQGLVWLALLVLAVTAIRRRDAARHARLMIAMAAVASGAIWLRLMMFAAVAAGLPFEEAYAVACWVCWIAPLAVAAALANKERPGFLPAVRSQAVTDEA